MDQKNEQIVPLRIKNLAELKRCIRPGTELVATSHSKHPTLVGLVRVVTEVQTNAYYSVVKDQPTHQYSTCNYGKGFRSDFEKASNYLFEGTTIKVLDRSALISKRHPTIYLRARPSRFLTAEAVITACCTKWSFIRANALCPARKAIRRRMRESGKTIAKSSRKGWA